MVLEVSLITLLLILLGFYYYLSKKSKRSTKSYNRLHKGYLVGLNFLLNEEPDKAVDIFIKMLEVDSDTVETHLALGKLFRRRGEVDRATRIHQNLIARPNLENEYRVQALIELGQDYLSAGVLDRAERVFQEVITIDENSEPALFALLDIYQQEKEWHKAMTIAKKINWTLGRNMQNVVAHHHCQLAELALEKNDDDACLQHLRQAVATDKKCVRANLLLAKYYLRTGQYKTAIKHLKKIKDQTPEFLPEVIGPLSECYEKMGNESGFVEYLENCLHEYPQTPLYLFLFERLQAVRKTSVSKEMVKGHILKHPSVNGLSLYVKLFLNEVGEQTKNSLAVIQTLLEELNSQNARYRCMHCGFPSKSLNWQCPSCREWGVVKPIHSYDELESEAAG
ncbi:MAG: lipopolysaccharide assembly protein LapB [Gammaproteobacteria bacterium]